MFSIIVPVLRDTAAATQLLAQIREQPDIEVIVVDGGRDEPLERLVASRRQAGFLRTHPGRAHQMNAGAAVASGEWLLFLHADSRLPPEWLEEGRRCLGGTEVSGGDGGGTVGGWFRFALDDPAWQARVIERLVAWRVRQWRLPYGDQGLFVRKDVFQRLGGFREMVFLEDIEFVRRLVRSGPVVEIPLPLLTSARRWKQDGWFRRSARNLAIVGLYLAGVSPVRLSRWYRGS